MRNHPSFIHFLFKVVFLLLTISALIFCTQRSDKTSETVPELYQGFVDPPADARPFVRWWWNGNHLDKQEIIRQLDVFKEAGIGGVEINPIAMPELSADIGTKSLVWLSNEWNNMLVFASQEAAKRGMIADMIVGSGWPFGGEFLKEEETTQRIIINKIPCSGGDQISEELQSLYAKSLAALSRSYGTATRYEMVFIRLVPRAIRSIADVKELTDDFNKNNRLQVDVPPGEYDLVYGIRQWRNREVMHGAPGAAGPVMNHYDRQITRAYLERLYKISEDTGVPLKEIIRALFCDSIELDGANWTDGFEDIFYDTYQYRLEPWYPFVFYDAHTGYRDRNTDQHFADKVKRVRYDYNKLLVRVFLDNFTREFRDFCTENGLLSRYQAYGTPFLMGMVEGNMIADIPESNNWIYSAPMDTEEWQANQQHGYMVWNMYASSGGHLTGRQIISNEAMTNTQGVFKTSLDEIKQHDDMNFITGMTHAVLHGYNYSPPEAGFPGWVRYGAYFSEQNPWWPYFPKWVDYNARLSYVFQHSQPMKSIAILGPEADIWSEYGLSRVPFHMEPWYANRLWEPLSQAGSSCDYISQNIIINGIKNNGTLTFGPMSYQAIFLAGNSSLEPEAANALLEFVGNGGTLVAIDGLPYRSPSFQNALQNDSVVNKALNELRDRYPSRLFVVDAPASEAQLLPWTVELLRQININKDVIIDKPDENVFQIRKKAGDKDIYFFTNSNRAKTIRLTATFPTGKKTPWVWNPEDGSRKVFPYDKNGNTLILELGPLQSVLLVFEPTARGKRLQDAAAVTTPPAPKSVITPVPQSAVEVQRISGPWEARFDHMSGETFGRSINTLSAIGAASADPQLRHFAGVVTYSVKFDSAQQGQWLRLGKSHKGVNEVFLNGKSLGVNWYGDPVFDIADALVKGENLLEIKHTTVLINYAISLKDEPTAQRWTRNRQEMVLGLEGDVVVLSE